MFKKIFSLGAALVMAFSLVACGGAKSAETVEGDFSLAVTVKKTRMSLDDTITMTLKNLSGRDVPIKTPDSNMTELEHLFTPMIFPYMEDIGCYILTDGLGHELIFEQDATIQCTIKLNDAFWVSHRMLGKRRLIGRVSFFVGDDYSKEIYMEANGRILINVK